MVLSLLFRQIWACLNWIVCEVRYQWPHSCSFAGYNLEEWKPIICPSIKWFLTFFSTSSWKICCKIPWTWKLVLHTQHNNNDDTIKTSDTVLRKIYLSLYLKVLCVRGSWRPNRTATYWHTHSYGYQRCVFLVLQGCSNGGPEAQFSAGYCFLNSIISPSLLIPRLNRESREPLLLGAGFLYHILSPTGLVS